MQKKTIGKNINCQSRLSSGSSKCFQGYILSTSTFSKFTELTLNLTFFFYISNRSPSRILTADDHILLGLHFVSLNPGRFKYSEEDKSL